MKIVKTALVVLALSLFGATVTPGVRADDYNNKTFITSSGPVEIPGQVLPAGKYEFILSDSKSDRDIVKIFNADGSHLIATLLAINNYRLVTTDQTVIKFSERPNDRPEAVKARLMAGLLGSSGTAGVSFFTRSASHCFLSVRSTDWKRHNT